MRNEFGFTNSVDEYEAIVAFRDAAVADGWSIKPTYPDHESIDRASTLEKSGFKMIILTRTKIGKWNYEAQINIWGPDGLIISPPDVYSWEYIKAGLRKCESCGATDVDTKRVAFANRCCEKCLPEMKAKYEKPGWCD